MWAPCAFSAIVLLALLLAASAQQLEEPAFSNYSTWITSCLVQGSCEPISRVLTEYAVSKPSDKGDRDSMPPPAFCLRQLPHRATGTMWAHWGLLPHGFDRTTSLHTLDYTKPSTKILRLLKPLE